MMPYVVHPVFAQEQMEENRETRSLTSLHNAISWTGQSWLMAFHI